MTAYTSHDVPVRGGALRVGAWRSADGPTEPQRIVLAVHGITSTHQVWPLVADTLTRDPGVLVLAADLRGRGRSADLPGPWGMAQHAQDLAAVLQSLAPGKRCILTGHSMGGFVAVMLAAARPDLVAGLVLVDGGVPLVLPPGWTLEAAAAVGLGPAADRLSMTFADRVAYQDFWRAHPAFAGAFTDTVADYIDYDLRPDGPPWRSSCVSDAMANDLAEQFVGGPVDRVWPDLAVPVTFLRAPRGLQDEPGGLYPEAGLDSFRVDHPDFHWRNVDDVNHYTITLGQVGAAQVGAAIAEQFESLPTVMTHTG
ncbi:MAG: lysophospholipase [Actinomycetota bacterium]|nr:lysophospholipase [Actinomycetota bacterium]MDQ2956990.1 lysophospholipase [Actinomycetota bacterium]